jgi:tRNA-intron endonuclease
MNSNDKTHREVESVFRDNKVVVPSQEDAEFLLESGYGIQNEDDKGSILISFEALYLLFDKRIRVIDEQNLNLDFQSLLKRFQEEDADSWTKYLVYRDLRSRGYVVRDGYGYGINFRVYGRGEYGKKAARYIVFTVYEGRPIPITKLKQVLSIAESSKKNLILAVVDRRGEIVYYTLQSLNLYDT